MARLVALAVIGVLSTVAAARASEDASEYSALIEAALDEYREAHWNEALALFQKAHELAPSARTWRGLGFASFELRRYADAIRYLGKALGDERKSLTPTQRGEVEALIARASAFVIRVRIEVQPEDAQLTVDGNAVDRDQRKSLLLDPGEHQIVARAERYDAAIRVVEWPPASQLTYEIELAPRAGARGQRGLSEPEAELAQPAAGRFKAAKYATLAATLAAAGTTALSVGLRESRAREFERRECSAYDEGERGDCERLHRAGNSWRFASIASGSAAGALGITTLLLFVFDGRAESAVGRALRTCAISGSSITCRAAF